jgi:hypothetical protein
MSASYARKNSASLSSGDGLKITIDTSKPLWPSDLRQIVAEIAELTDNFRLEFTHR